MNQEKYDYEILLFDLDGTLTDPKEGIINSVKYALSYFGIKEDDDKKLLGFIGPPLIDGFMHYYGFTVEQAIEAREKYREYYSEKGVLENSVYEGIEDLLKKLKSKGKRLFVATSKPIHYAEIILKHFGLHHYFEAICGAELGERQHKKSNVIAHAIQLSREEDLSRILMIGDRMYDVIGANETGVDCACVLFGYGEREEFLPYFPKYIVGTLNDLERLLI